MQRIREGFLQNVGKPLPGPKEVDEAFFGGKESNKHARKRLNAGRGPVGKTAVVGVKDRDENQIAAEVIPDTKQETLHEFVKKNVEGGRNALLRRRQSLRESGTG